MYLVVMSKINTLINYEQISKSESITYNQNVDKKHELYKVKSSVLLPSHCDSIVQQVCNNCNLQKEHRHSDIKISKVNDYLMMWNQLSVSCVSKS